MRMIRTFVGDVAMVLDHHIVHCRWDWLCELVDWEVLHELKSQGYKVH